MAVRIKRTSRSEIELPAADVDGLRAGLRGDLLLTGDPGYDGARSIWNAMIDRRPAMIAQCLGTADVVACVNFARDNDLVFTIKGGGHNIAGLAVCDGGLMIDMSRMRGVWVDADSRTAHAQSGCLLGDLDRETQVHGLAAVLGFVSNTGIAGYTLGGGFGYLTRRFGWACDNLRGLDVVTADGRLVRADHNENSDLFWGLRGGGGNFGVVTGFEYELYPIGPEVMAGGIAWSLDDVGPVLEMYRGLIEQAPRELTCAAVLRMAPPAPWLDTKIHGKPIIALFVIHSGSLSDGEAAVAPIKAFGNPVGDVIQRRPYVTQQALLDATQPDGRRYYWKSEYLPGVNEELVGKFVEHTSRIVSPHSGIVLFPIDGALNGLPQDHSPMGNRDAKTVLNITASWDEARDDEANVDWARTAWREMRPFSTGGTYVNFLTEEEGNDRIRDAYGSNYDRLVEIKSAWDPNNLFRTNKNIGPGGD